MSELASNEQQKRMATREFVGADPEQTEISYTIQVSSGRVWLHRTGEEWDNADGTGRDTGHDCWVMSTEDLKKFVECAAWAIQKSEAFEAAHPNEQIIKDCIAELRWRKLAVIPSSAAQLIKQRNLPFVGDYNQLSALFWQIVNDPEAERTYKRIVESDK